MDRRKPKLAFVLNCSCQIKIKNNPKKIETAGAIWVNKYSTK